MSSDFSMHSEIVPQVQQSCRTGAGSSDTLPGLVLRSIPPATHGERGRRSGVVVRIAIDVIC